MNNDGFVILNEKHVIDSFSRHAKTYDRYAQLQKSMAERLASLLPSPLPENILEIGCGTGFFTRHLLKQPAKKLVLNDIAPGMLEILGNSLTLPLNTEVFLGNAEKVNFENMNLICANAVFQWFQNLQEALMNLHQALTTKGGLIFSTFGPKTLIELRQAANLASPINLYDNDIWKKMIIDSGFSIKYLDVEIRKIFFSNSLSLLKNLQQIGAAPLRMVRTGGLRKLLREYDSKYSTAQGVYATWELYYFSLVREN